MPVALSRMLVIGSVRMILSYWQMASVKMIPSHWQMMGSVIANNQLVPRAPLVGPSPHLV